VLQAAVDTDNRLFAIELAVAASGVDALSLAAWLTSLFAENTTAAVKALTSFLSRKLEGQTGLRTFVPLEQTSLEQIAVVRFIS
jgi:hypothetical protein